MKDLLLKGLILGALIILVTQSCCCNGSTEITERDKNYPSVDTADGINIRIYTIDNCEYIGNIQFNFIAHKGNCKYCFERRLYE